MSPEIETYDGEQFDDPNRQAVGLEPAWVEGEGGDDGDLEGTPVKAENDTKLPGRHAELDELAAERGHEWSDEDLTVAQKQAELGG